MSPRSLTEAPRYRWIIFWILALQYLFVYFHRVCPAVVAPELMNAFSIGGVSLGLLASGYFYPYAIMQLPVGLLSDSWGPRKTLTLFATLSAAGAILFGLATTFGVALFARVLVGLGVSAVFIATLKVFSAWFRPTEYATASGVLMAMGGIGWLCAATPLAWMSQSVGWRATFIGIGCITVLLTFLTWAFVVDDPSQKGFPSLVGSVSPPGPTATNGPLSAMRAVITQRGVWPLATWFFCNGWILFGFCGLWAGPYLMDVYRLSKTSVGNILSMIACGMIVGGPLLGYLSDNIVQSKKKVLVGCSFLLLLEWISFFIVYKSLPLVLLYIFFLLIGICLGATVAVAFTAVKELLPAEIAGTSLSAISLFGFVAGIIAQPLIGFIMDSVGKVGDGYLPGGYRLTFLVLLFASLIMFLSTLFFREEAKSLHARASRENLTDSENS